MLVPKAWWSVAIPCTTRECLTLAVLHVVAQLFMRTFVLQAWVAMGGNASAAEKLRQQAAWQKQTFNPRDSAASGQVCFKAARWGDSLMHSQSHAKNSVRPHGAACGVIT